MFSNTLYRIRLVGSITYELTSALLSLPALFLPRGVMVLFQSRFGPATKSRTEHDLEVSKVAESVRRAYRHNRRIVLYRKPGHGHSARSVGYKNGHEGVDVASLTSIIGIDRAKETVEVQAGVTFEELCKATLKYGLLPLVVPEFKSITVGGAIQGIGIESSSWRHGAVDESVLSATLILGDGTIVSSSDVPELWKDIPGSNGSLALLVSATLRLAKATQDICVRYEVFSDLSAYISAVDQMPQDETWTWLGSDRLVDAVLIRDVGIVGMFAGCVMQSTMSGSRAVHYVESAFSPFYFQHIQEVSKRVIAASPHQDDLDSGSTYVEYVPTMQYLFRYDRGGFWGIMALAQMFAPLDYVLRSPKLSGWLNHFLKTSTLYKIAMLLNDADREGIAMLQDVDVPKSQASTVVDWALDHDIQLIWLCPVKNSSDSMFSVSGGSEWVMNIGLYGTITGLPHANLEMQRLVYKCKGKTALYAHIYAKAEEFWSWYDHKRYKRLREEYRGTSFLDLWLKVGSISTRASVASAAVCG